MIERSIKIFTTIALFLEGEKKREKQIKQEQKRKKELQQAKAKKKAEDKKDKGQAKDKADGKEAEGDQQQPEEAKAELDQRSRDLGPEEGATDLNNGAASSLVDVAGANLAHNNEPSSPVDALMNADSDDDDDDIHGEGSQSQQHDLQIQENQMQQQQLAVNADGHIDGGQ